MILINHNNSNKPDYKLIFSLQHATFVQKHHSHIYALLCLKRSSLAVVRGAHCTTICRVYSLCRCQDHTVLQPAHPYYFLHNT